MLQFISLDFISSIGFGNGREIRAEVRLAVRDRRRELLPIPVGFFESEQYLGIPDRKAVGESRIRLREKIMQKPFADSSNLIFHNRKGVSHGCS